MEIVVYLLRSHEVKGGNLGCGRLPFFSRDIHGLSLDLDFFGLWLLLDQTT